MLEKEKNKFILGKYKLKEGMLNLLSSKKTTALKLYKNFLDDNLKNLKRIDATSTRSSIEFKLNKNTSYPAFNWQEELVSLNNIFAMMLGIIDARNDQHERSLEFQRSFNETEEIHNIESKQKELNEIRIGILKDYESVFVRKDMEVIKETMKCNPSYLNFNNLFKDMNKNSYSLVIQGQLISSYMLGYNNSLYIHPQDIISYYDQIISNYKLDKTKNDYNKQKVNSLLKQKIQ